MTCFDCVDISAPPLLLHQKLQNREERNHEPQSCDQKRRWLEAPSLASLTASAKVIQQFGITRGFTLSNSQYPCSAFAGSKRYGLYGIQGYFVGERDSSTTCEPRVELCNHKPIREITENRQTHCPLGFFLVF